MTDSQRRNHGEPAARLEVAADADGVSAVLRRAIAFAGETGLGDGARMRLEIVVEELARNMVLHGRAPEGATIAFSFANLPDGVLISTTDRGIAFDPRTTLRQGSEEHGTPEDEGGSGWPLIHAWCRIEAYRRTGTENRLDLVLILAPEGGGPGA